MKSFPYNQWLFCLLMLPIGLFAQSEYEIAAAGKTVIFQEIGHLTVVGTDANQMRIVSEGGRERNERSEGLRVISASGIQDNTGLGLSVTESDGTITVAPVGRKNGHLRVELPNSTVLQFTQSTPQHGGALSIEDFSGEIDVTMMYHAVYLTNVSGPTAVNTVYQGIEAVLDRVPEEEMRLHSTYKDVDLSLPASARTTLRLATSFGDMFTDFDLTVAANSDSDDAYLEGTINGGGTLISLQSTYNDIYIRKR